MLIEKISLQNFRSYRDKKLSFSKTKTLLVGANAVGKTNLLEAIYLLATGRSFRAKLEREMISYKEQLARVQAQIKSGNQEKNQLEIVLTKGEINGQRTAKKIYKVNGVGKRMIDFVGNLRVVYFGPEDLEIVIDSPSIRRNYLDSVLEQVDREYRRAFVSYKKGLRQRNRLLEQIRDEGKPRSVLFFWDRLLVENGAVITRQREEFLNFVNQQPAHFGQLQLDYDKSLVSPQRLAKYAAEEVAAGMTLVGPHRDDFRLSDKEHDLSLYGSRGEQRTAIFSLKLAELEYMAEKACLSAGRANDRPVLLLDDIFSELDHQHRAHLLEVIPQQQTIITTTDIHLVEPGQREKMEIINL